jgi:hypothetical protein
VLSLRDENHSTIEAPRIKLAFMPNQPWGDIPGMGDRLRHAYDCIDLDVLWNSIRPLPTFHIEGAGTEAESRFFASSACRYRVSVRAVIFTHRGQHSGAVALAGWSIFDRRHSAFPLCRSGVASERFGRKVFSVEGDHRA